MSIFKQFQTDKQLETDGVVIQYDDDTRITVARSGGANQQYQKVLAAKLKPYRRAISANMMDEKKLLSLVEDAFIEGCIRNWEVRVDGEWKQAVQVEDGSLQPFKPDVIKAVFKALPDLYLDLQNQSANIALYRQEELEEDAKN